jgi:hypothetical protein
MPALFSTPHQTRKIAEFLAKPEVKEMSSGLEEIAQAVAVAVEDKALTDRIYEKCMEKFDGETNTLWMHLEADSKLKSQGGWNKRVDAELSKGRKNATVKGIGNIDAAVKKFEKTMNAPLHLFWAFPANWDKKTTPIVAYFPLNAGDPEKLKTVPAFDSKGNRIELDNYDPTVAKQRPVIFVTLNERSSVNGEVKSGLMVVNADGTRIIPVANQNIPDKKGGATIQAAGETVRVNWVTVSATAGQIDEPYGEGTTEWIGTAQNYNPYVGWESTWSTMNLGTYVARYNPSYVHTLVMQNGIAKDVHFKYYEDDFTVGYYDIFDDWYGFHQFTATLGQAAGYYWPAQTLERTEAGTTGNYTFY